MSNQPPKYADRFLEWFCDPLLVEDLQGDLYEIYFQKLDQGKRRADLMFWWLVIRSFRPSAFKSSQKLKIKGFMITRNNFKIAWRLLLRDKANSSINLLGLTIGITCFLLLGLYVKQELSYDQFHAKKDRIYRMWLKEDYGDGRVFFNSNTPLRFEQMMEDNFPEVEKAIQYIERSDLIGRGEKRIEEKTVVISPDFFEVFDFKIIKGNRQQPFSSKNSVILSASYAEKYFGRSDPIGQMLPIQLLEDTQDFMVSAVMEDIPKESGIQFGIAVSTEWGRDLYGERGYNAWFNIIPETYILLKEGQNIASVNEKTQDVILSQLGDQGYGGEPIKRDQYNLGFQPLTDIHMNPDIPLGYMPVGNPQYVMILGVIGLLVIIIACINYATLTVGQSLRRAKEVGIRKVLGAFGSQLTSQYMIEGILVTLIAMAFGVVLSILLVPAFNNLTGTDLVIDFQWWHLLIYLGLAILIGMISSFYPAVVHARFKAADILKGGSQSVGKGRARNIMVIFQFVITVFLISTALLIRKQVNYLQNKDIGINYDAVVSVRLHTDPSAQRLSERLNSAFEHGELLKQKLSKHPEISTIGMGSHVFGTNGWAHLAFNDNNDKFKWFRLLIVDPEYFEVFDIDAVEGRLFERGNTLDESQGVLLNQAAVELMELEDPVGKQLPSDEFGDHQIVGVVETFHFSSLHNTIEPLVIVQNPGPILSAVTDADIIDSWIPKLVFEYNGANLHEATKILQEDWEATFPNIGWNFEFVDERIRGQYENEARMNKLITVATVLSIVIATLGLLGLILIVVNSKVKEIGIRKVLGASTSSLFKLLAKAFSIQILIAIILSVPLTLWLIDKWLDNFAYRTSIDPWVFILSGLLSIGIAGIVIVFHTARASKVNPVEALRDE